MLGFLGVNIYYEVYIGYCIFLWMLFRKNKGEIGSKFEIIL